MSGQLSVPYSETGGSISFRVDREPCFPVTGYREGEVSLRDLLLHAHEITGIDTGNAPVAGALYRLALAAALDVLPPITSPQDWERVWSHGQFEKQSVDAFLAQHGPRWDLFDAEAPFLQCPGLEAASGLTKPVTALALETPSGNNTPLFSATTEGSAVALTPAEAFRNLAATLAFGTAGILTGAAGDPQVKAGKTTGNPTGPMGRMGAVIPLGSNLYQTLMLSHPLRPLAPGDVAVWASPPPTPQWSTRFATGLLDLLTFPSRRVRLVPAEVAGDVVVERVVVAAGDRLPFLPPDLEPHTAWRAIDGDEVSQRPVRHQPGRGAWRGLETLLAVGEPTTGGRSASNALVTIGSLAEYDALPSSYPLRLFVVGVSYGVQSAVIEHVVADELPLPVAALRSQEGGEFGMRLQSIVTSAEAVMRAVNGAANNLRQTRGGDPTPWNKGQRPGEVLIHGLASDAQRLLAGLAQEPERLEEALDAWEVLLRTRAWDVVGPMLDAAPADAFWGREVNGRQLPLALIESYFHGALNKALPRTTHQAGVVS